MTEMVKRTDPSQSLEFCKQNQKTIYWLSESYILTILKRDMGAFSWWRQLKKQDVNDRIMALTQLISYYVYIEIIFNYVMKGKKKGRTISSPAFMREEVTAVTSSLF